MADDDIGGKLRVDPCDDCGCRQHWKKECDCGCPDGPTRKRQRDEAVAGAHSDSVRNTSPGFY